MEVGADDIGSKRVIGKGYWPSRRIFAHSINVTACFFVSSSVRPFNNGVLYDNAFLAEGILGLPVEGRNAAAVHVNKIGFLGLTFGDASDDDLLCIRLRLFSIKACDIYSSGRFLMRGGGLEVLVFF